MSLSDDVKLYKSWLDEAFKRVNAETTSTNWSDKPITSLSEAGSDNDVELPPENDRHSD